MDQNKLEQNINDLIETVGYIKDNMATKDDLIVVNGRLTTVESGLTEVKNDLAVVKDDLAIVKDDVGQLAGHIAGMETRLVTKSYLDDKLADLSAEIGDRINRGAEKDKSFKGEAVNLLERNQIGKAEELSHLRGLI